MADDYQSKKIKNWKCMKLSALYHVLGFEFMTVTPNHKLNLLAVSSIAIEWTLGKLRRAEVHIFYFYSGSEILCNCKEIGVFLILGR